MRILIRSDDEKAVELALLAMDVEYEPVESSERGRSFRTVLQTECRGEDVLITVTNSHRAAKPSRLTNGSFPKKPFADSPKRAFAGSRRGLAFFGMCMTRALGIIDAAGRSRRIHLKTIFSPASPDSSVPVFTFELK